MVEPAQSPFIAVLRKVPTASVREIVDILLEAGLGTVEITMDSESFDDDIAQAMAAGACVGAGTVRSVSDVHRACSLGASFLASPALEEHVVSAAHEHGIRMLPGCFTPTDIAKAVDFGCAEVKIFPASVYGPNGIAALHKPFSEVGFVTTGGIGLRDFARYMAAGASQVGIGVGQGLSRDDVGPVVEAIESWTRTETWAE